MPFLEANKPSVGCGLELEQKSSNKERDNGVTGEK